MIIRHGRNLIAIMALVMVLTPYTLYAAKELDADGNGAMDIANGGTNAQTVQAARNNLGLGNVDNTHDADKSISTATQAALDTKIETIQPGTNISVDNTDPTHPIVNATGSGSGSTDLHSPGEIGDVLPAPAHFTYLQCDSLDINPPPAGATGEMAVHEDPDSAGDDMIGFKAPTDVNLDGSQAGDLLWILPADDGLSGQVMATDGAQTLGWVTPLVKSNNLSDLDNVAAARTALDVPSNSDLQSKQNAITGSCGVGEFIVSINNDGTIVCSPAVSHYKVVPLYSDSSCAPGDFAWDSANKFSFMCVSQNHWDYRDETGAWVVWDYPDPIITINTETGHAYSLNDSSTIGQTWTVPQGGDGNLSKVILQIDSVTTSGTITCRASTSSGQLDLSSNYAKGSASVAAPGEIAVQFPTPASMSVGDVMSVACQVSSGTTANFSYSNSNPYSDGNKYTTRTLTWDLGTVGLLDINDDFYFKYSR